MDRFGQQIWIIFKFLISIRYRWLSSCWLRIGLLYNNAAAGIGGWCILLAAMKVAVIVRDFLCKCSRFPYLLQCSLPLSPCLSPVYADILTRSDSLHHLFLHIMKQKFSFRFRRQTDSEREKGNIRRGCPHHKNNIIITWCRPALSLDGMAEEQNAIKLIGSNRGGGGEQT